MSCPSCMEALLAPLQLDKFLAEIWGRCYYHGRATSPHRFAGLLSDSRFEELLSAMRPNHDILGLFKNGQRLPFDELVMPDGAVDMVQLRSRYAEGYSIVLNGVERFSPELRQLTNAIAVELDFESQINVYATPPLARGFSPHFDDHDVLVLQVRGTKTWHLHTSSPIVPPERFRQKERAVDRTTLGEPDRILLSPGDILYLPRGLVHAAETGTRASIHLSIGFHPPTLMTLLSASLDARSLFGGKLLERLPPRYLRERDVRKKIAATVRSLAASIEDSDVDLGLMTLKDRLIRSGRCRTSGVFIGITECGLSGESLVERSVPLPARLVEADKHVGLQFSQGLVVADPNHRCAFEYLLEQCGPFKVADLPGLVPEAQLALAEKLVQDGFLKEA